MAKIRITSIITVPMTDLFSAHPLDVRDADDDHYQDPHYIYSFYFYFILSLFFLEQQCLRPDLFSAHPLELGVPGVLQLRLQVLDPASEQHQSVRSDQSG
jgi:hypothetical protein